MSTSPYSGRNKEEWLEITKKLVESHPLSPDKIVSVCLQSWKQIFSSTIGGVIKIGEDIKLSPQMIGNFMHVLIAHNLAQEEPTLFRKEDTSDEKDIVYIPDNNYSFEIKSSSSKGDIYGNRSYGQQDKTTVGKKSKDGYYLAINFDNPKGYKDPQITQIKFGWLDHTDWIAQLSPTGQQSRLTPEAKKLKLLKIYP